MHAPSSNGTATRAYQPLTLAAAGGRTPPLAGIGAWAEKLREAAFDAVKAEDITAIIASQVEKAKAGDQAAARFVLGYLTGQAAPKVEKVIERVKIIDRRGGKGVRSAERVRVESAPAAPPVPVAIDSPSARQLRKLAALYLIANRPCRKAELERELEVETSTLDAVLAHEWFALDGGLWAITPAGRGAMG